MSDKKRQNEEIAHAAINKCGASALACARLINETEDTKAQASIALSFDMTADQYGRSDTYAVNLNGAWLIVETRRGQ
jgi:hypothetical protein